MKSLVGVCGARYEILKQAVERFGPDRLLYGSDFPFGGRGNVQYQLEKVYALPIGEEAKEKILFRNALTLLPSFVD